MEQKRFNSLAEFKRLATKGRFVRGGYFNTTRGERVRNDWREIIGVQSNAVKLKTDGVAGGVYFDFPKAGECELEQLDAGTKLKIYEDRVQVGNSDIPASTSWLKWELEQGTYTENDLKRYRKQVAEYELGELVK